MTLSNGTTKKKLSKIKRLKTYPTSEQKIWLKEVKEKKEEHGGEREERGLGEAETGGLAQTARAAGAVGAPEETGTAEIVRTENAIRKGGRG